MRACVCFHKAYTSCVCLSFHKAHILSWCYGWLIDWLVCCLVRAEWSFETVKFNLY